MAEKIEILQDEYDKLKQHLDELQSRRKGIAEEIATARGHGDLSENAEYDAALDEQAELEEEIRRVEDRIHNAHILTEEELSTNEVNVGHVVKVKDLDHGDQVMYYEIVGQDPDPFQEIPKITLNSAIGANLKGKKKGTKVEIPIADDQILHYQILSITRRTNFKKD